MGILRGLGFAVAGGFNGAGSLFLLALLAQAHQLTVSDPTSSWLVSTTVLGLLGVLALIETALDKLPGLDHLGHLLGFPLAIGSGALGAVAMLSGQPGTGTLIAAAVLGGLVAGGVHTVRTLTRNVALGFLPVVLAMSIAEDLFALTLVGAATYAPVLVPVLLLVAAVLGVLLIRTLVKLLARIFRSVSVFWESYRQPSDADDELDLFGEENEGADNEADPIDAANADAEVSVPLPPLRSSSTRKEKGRARPRTERDEAGIASEDDDLDAVLLEIATPHPTRPKR